MSASARAWRIALRALALGLVCSGCTGAAPNATTVLAASPGHQTLVLLPLNVATPLPAELGDSSAVVWSALRDYVRGQGATLKTLPLPVARQLWLASIRAAQTAKGKQSGFDDAAVYFVRRLAENADFDAVIMPSLFVQRAHLEGVKAEWDGVERELEFEMARRSVSLPENLAVEGAAPAASLHAIVLDAAGAKLQEQQAGLALLVRIRVGSAQGSAEDARFSFIPIDQPFADRAQLTAGIARALAPFLPDRSSGSTGPDPPQDVGEPAPRS
jgi:hypothetical protein